MKQKTAKYIFIILGAAVTVLGLCISFTSNINAGVIMTVLLGVLLLAIGIFSRHAFAMPRWIRILFFAALAVFFVSSSFLMIYGHCDTADGNEDAIDSSRRRGARQDFRAAPCAAGWTPR